MVLRSMRMIGEKARGATLTANEQTECLAELNTFMEATANERLLCYQITEDTKALTASTASYTIGIGGDINVTRPVKIVDPCFVRDASGFDTPVRIINAQSYGRIVDKDAGYTVPTELFYDTGFSATSTGTIYLYPAPSSALTLHINSWKQLGTFADLSTTVLLPPGYQLFIESNFAIHLAAGVRPVPTETARIARDSKAWVKSLNQPDTVARLDSAVATQRGSIFTGP